MRYILLFLLVISSSANANFLNFIDLNMAKKAYEKEQYNAAAEIYSNFDNDFAKNINEYCGNNQYNHQCTRKARCSLLSENVPQSFSSDYP